MQTHIEKHGREVGTERRIEILHNDTCVLGWAKWMGAHTHDGGLASEERTKPQNRVGEHLPNAEARPLDLPLTGERANGPRCGSKALVEREPAAGCGVWGVAA